MISTRLGGLPDVEAAASVYERSSLAYHQGNWPKRAERVASVIAHLREAETWFVVAFDGPAIVGMASAKPFRMNGGAGSIVPGQWFLSYLYVDPERWGEGIGGVLLDAVVSEAMRRNATKIYLRTYEENERAHRLYRRRGFKPTGRVAGGQGEWMYQS